MRPSSVWPVIRTPGSLPDSLPAYLPASGLRTLRSSTVTTVPLNSCLSQWVAPMRSRSPRAISRGEAARSSSEPRLTVTVTRSVSAGMPSGIAENRRARIRCDSARTSARVRASTTLVLSGCNPPVTVPVVDQAGQGVGLVMADMEPPPGMMGRDGGGRIAVAQRRRRRHLPRGEGRLVRHRLVIADNAVAFRPAHEPGPDPCRCRRLAMDMDQDILQVGLLAPDAVDPHAADGVADQSQPRSRLDRLLLPGVAGKDDLGAMAFGELQNVMGLAGRQHPGLVDDNGGVPC